MASIEPRRNSSGSTSYRVKFREGGGRAGKQRTYTFRSLPQAERFRELVGTRNRLPAREVLHAEGLGWVIGEVEAEEEPELTVAALVEAYLDSLDAEGTCAATTIRGYRRTATNHIASRPLGGLPAGQVGGSDILGWQRSLLDDGLSPETITSNTRGSVLGAAYRWGCSAGLVEGNPLAGVKAPPAREWDGDWLRDPEECRIYLEVCQGSDPDAQVWVPLLVFLLATGVRITEATTRAPEHVDRRRRMLLVDSRLKRGRVREVPLPSVLVEQVVAPAAERGGRWLFANPNGGQWASSVIQRKHDRINRLLPAAGLRRHVTPHTLRHTYTSWLMSHGIAEAKVADLLGHKSGKRRSMTARYTHLMEADYDQVRDAAELLVKGFLA